MPIQLSKLLGTNIVSNPLIPSKSFSTQTTSSTWAGKDIVPSILPGVPPIKLGVQYPNLVINEGTVVKPRQAKDEPEVSWVAKDQSAMSAVLMIDPDAPSVKDPKLRCWKHWLVVNIPGTKLAQGEIIADYIGAGPPKDSGMHRYIFLLFTYPKKITITAKKMGKTGTRGRGNLNVQNFIKKYNIGQPVAGNFFLAEFDDYVPELLAQIGFK